MKNIDTQKVTEHPTKGFFMLRAVKSFIVDRIHTSKNNNKVFILYDLEGMKLYCNEFRCSIVD